VFRTKNSQPMGIRTDGTRYERELEVAFPIRTRGHDLLHPNRTR
jgi:hypothetical protein